MYLLVVSVMIKEYWKMTRKLRIQDKPWIDFVPIKFRNQAHTRYIMLNGLSF